MKGQHDHGNSYNRKLLIGNSYHFRDLFHYCHGGKHGGNQADMVLEQELGVLYFDPEAEQECMPHRA